MKQKKVVIFTWCYDYGTANYGQILQCLALYRFCEEKGFDVKVLKYRKLSCDENYDTIPPKGKSRDDYEKEYRVKKLEDGSEKFYKAFNDFIKENIKRTNICYTLEEVKKECEATDILLIGSDQVWNPKVFDDVYCPEFQTKEQIIFSYATGGITNLAGSNNNVVKEIARRINKFDAVSVRESISAEILKIYTDKKINIVVDPTFLLGAEEWDKIATQRLVEKKYILCFCYGKIQPQKHIIKAIQQKNSEIENVCVVKVDHFYEEFNVLDNMRILDEVGPSELISLIKHADIVCTDSFHGLALSLIFKKQFYLLYRAYVSHEAASPYRMSEICARLGIGNRWVRCKRELDFVDVIDYDQSEEKRKKAIKESMDYLDLSLRVK